MDDVGAYTAKQWEGDVKAIINDSGDDKRAAKILAWDVYNFLKACWWWDDKFKDSVTVHCAKSDIGTEGRCWHIPCTTSSELTVNLKDLTIP